MSRKGISRKTVGKKKELQDNTYLDTEKENNKDRTPQTRIWKQKVGKKYIFTIEKKLDNYKNKDKILLIVQYCRKSKIKVACR